MTDSENVAADLSTAPLAVQIDLASERVGGRAIATNDDFFAPMSNLVKIDPPAFVPGKYTARGKWMDGWESRRRRTPGHDWCVVALGIRGVIGTVIVDTTHFTGNYPSHCSIDALDTTARLTPAVSAAAGPPWTTILDKQPLTGNSPNLFEIRDRRPWTHVRLNIFPDGGVARLRVFGDAVIDWAPLARARRIVDLAAVTNGGVVVRKSDSHFGIPNNMLMPGRAKNMSDGWETRRRRGPGHDWAIVRLGAPGLVRRVEIDTNHYKGNFPESASLEGCFAPRASIESLASAAWTELLPRTKLRAHHRHLFSRQLRRSQLVSHVRLNIFPDGGISRLRIYGTVATP
jgi:allantoicase